MHLMRKNTVCLTLAATLSLISLGVQAWEKDKTYQITILHTNDHHGHFWQSDIGEYGLAAQKTVIDKIRQEVEKSDGSLLLLSGGDINTGVPESDLLDAEPDFKGMSLIGYDAMAVGNHEFDNPLETIRKQEEWSSFPLLSANIYEKGSNKRLFKPYKLFDKQGVKIAVIGLTTNDTPKISMPANVENVEFRLPVNEAKQVVEKLKQNEKPDIIIAATHMGHYDDGKSGSDAPGDVEMARALPAGYLDLIVGGHSQDPVCMVSENVKQTDYLPGSPCTPDRQNGTWIVQAHEWGKYVGRADFTFRNGEFKLVNYQLIPINLMQEVPQADGTSKLAYYTDKIEADPAMLALLTPYQEQGQQKLQMKIGSINGKLEGRRDVIRAEQTNMSRFILAAFMERTKADFGVISGGNVRDSMLPGNLTYKDVLKVLPFANGVAYADMKGSEVLEYLAVVANKTSGSGAYAQLANVSLVADGKGVSAVKIKDQPIDPYKTYRVTMLNFLGSGGDGYPKLDNKPGYVDTGFIDAEVLKDYIEKHSPIDVAQFAPKGEIIYK